jgi:gamma-glutamyl:cysteine ligase YbdK (ATP-grasp superfamily)
MTEDEWTKSITDLIVKEFDSRPALADDAVETTLELVSGLLRVLAKTLSALPDAKHAAKEVAADLVAHVNELVALRGDGGGN